MSKLWIILIQIKALKSRFFNKRINNQMEHLNNLLFKTVVKANNINIYRKNFLLIKVKWPTFKFRMIWNKGNKNKRYMKLLKRYKMNKIHKIWNYLKKRLSTWDKKWREMVFIGCGIPIALQFPNRNQLDMSKNRNSKERHYGLLPKI